jgi:hypothetical protein
MLCQVCIKEKISLCWLQYAFRCLRSSIFRHASEYIVRLNIRVAKALHFCQFWAKLLSQKQLLWVQSTHTYIHALLNFGRPKRGYWRGSKSNWRERERETSQQSLYCILALLSKSLLTSMQLLQSIRVLDISLIVS